MFGWGSNTIDMWDKSILAGVITIFSWFIFPYVLFLFFRYFNLALKNLPVKRVLQAMVISQLLYGIIFVILYTMTMIFMDHSPKVLFFPLQALSGLFL